MNVRARSAYGRAIRGDIERLFPARSRADTDAVLRAFFRYRLLNRAIYRLTMAFPLVAAQLSRLVPIVGREHMEAANRSPGPVIVATAHLGSLYFMSLMVARAFAGRRIYVMHKKNIADTARDEAFMRRCKLIPVAADESGLRTLVRAIQADPRTGIMLAFDPPLGNRHSITFLGARLRVATGVGLLADVGRCPVVPWFWEYTASGPRVVIEKPIVVDEGWPLPLRRNAIVERLYALLAERVARIPEQWHLDFVHQGVVDERPKAPERQLCGRFAVSLADLFRNEPDIVRYAAGDVIFSAGDDADAMYVVIEGDVEIRLKDIAIDVAHVGEIVGEMALIDHSPRSASVIALSASRLARIDRRRFLYLIQNTPTFALDVMTVMAGRLRRGNALRERLESST